MCQAEPCGPKHPGVLFRYAPFHATTTHASSTDSFVVLCVCVCVSQKLSMEMGEMAYPTTRGEPAPAPSSPQKSGFFSPKIRSPSPIQRPRRLSPSPELSSQPWLPILCPWPRRASGLEPRQTICTG